MKKAARSKLSIFLHLILSIALLSSCSVFRGLIGEAKIRHPEVDFAGARLTKLSFDAADFMFDLRVRNPNRIGLKMAGFDYDFLINGSSFLKGSQESNLEIEAEGESTIQLPLSLGFLDLYQVFRSLRDQDVSTYQLDCSFSFDVPVLGAVRIPVTRQGEFPLLKVPKIRLHELELKSLTLSGADLQLRVRMDNPNAFSMILDKIRYSLEINGQNWVSGYAEESAQVGEKGESFVEVPIFLDFLQIGRSVSELLRGDRDLSYQFMGSIDLTTSLPLLGQVSLPFDHSGSVKIIR